jgi:8-oxo-dGTP diphosphatase
MPPPYCYDYPRPQVTVDLVVFGFIDQAVRILLIRRGREPFAVKWAIPGGFLEMDEAADAGARRELNEETGVNISGPIDPIGCFADPARDPRGRTITLAHAAVVSPGMHLIKGADDADDAAWIKVGEPVALAFDHAKILASAVDWLSRGIVAKDLALRLLPATFAARDVHLLYGAVGLPADHGTAWINSLVEARRLRALPGPHGSFHVVEGTR